MSCGGRIYKGDTVTISVPFDIEDYSNLTITYSTLGDEKIVKTQEEVEIEDGFITYTFEPGELDLLPDGVIYYTIECEVNGVPNVDSTNTNLYLKTPAGYSGRTAEDIYQEGYEEGLEDCSGSSCNLQSKSVVVSANTQTVSPDQGYDGMSSVSIDANTYAQEMFDRGYDSGYEDAEEDYPSIQYQKNFTATTITAIIPKDWGFDAMRQVNLDATPVFNQGYQSGLTACSGETPCDCSSAITEAYQSGITEGIAQQKSLLGSVTFTHNSTFTNHSGWSAVTVDVPKDVVLGAWVDSPSLSDLIDTTYRRLFDPEHYIVDGWGEVNLDMKYLIAESKAEQKSLMSAATFTQNGVYTRENGWSDVTVDVPQCDCSSAITEAYQSGYTAGLEACSGGTCPTETGLINLDSGWSGYESYQPLGSGYYDEVIISDAGYGQAKFDQGYELGLATCSASSGSCLIEPEQTASLGYDWTGFTIVSPSQGYDGLGRVLVADLGYGQTKYDQGYNAGLHDCSATTCNLTPFDYQLLPAWDGYLSFSASQASFDGFSTVSIIDLGYGQAKFDQGFQSGYSSSPCRNLITFKVRNATNIVADLSLLSFSVNGVPVEDVGAIFQTEEIQNFNYTTLWISGYTQPTSITGVVIEIKGENISGNSFNYDWNLFTEINGAEYEAASRSQEFFDIIDDNNKSRRIIYTYTGITLYNEYSFEAGKDYGIEVGKPIGYKEGMDSVIKSVLDENDTDLVIAYYYTSAYTNCLITGEYDFPQHDIHIDGNECISAMSINGGVWQPVQKYLHLQSGWTQIRFRVLNGGYRAMFSHFFTPSEECYMDALKVVSIPSGYCAGGQMFRDNEGLRVLSTSCGVLSCYGANNLNVVITHYTGSQRQFDYFPSNGVLFIPEGSTADWASILPNWTHIEMF